MFINDIVPKIFSKSQWYFGVCMREKRLQEDFSEKMDLWITCSRISGKADSTEYAGKCHFQLANYLHPSRSGLKQIQPFSNATPIIFLLFLVIPGEF